jgi:hypothetical protein
MITLIQPRGLQVTGHRISSGICEQGAGVNIWVWKKHPKIIGHMHLIIAVFSKKIGGYIVFTFSIRPYISALSKKVGGYIVLTFSVCPYICSFEESWQIYCFHFSPHISTLLKKVGGYIVFTFSVGPCVRSCVKQAYYGVYRPVAVWASTPWSRDLTEPKIGAIWLFSWLVGGVQKYPNLDFYLTNASS